MENKIFTIKIADLGISQLYINREKLNEVAKWFDISKVNEYDPLPVYNFGNGRYTLTDGHTRAYTMLKNGVEDVRVQLDLDEMITCDLGQRLYSTDIEWCNKYGMHGVSDFEKKIISIEEYNQMMAEFKEKYTPKISSLFFEIAQ